MKKKLLGLIGGFVGMLLLILDSRTAIAGAQEGIDLCIRSVIPSLFPFLILSVLLSSVLVGIPFKFLHKAGSLLGIPNGAEGIFLTGLAAGYPVGAQMVTQLWERGRISKWDAQRMQAFCSNCGPAFLFGILGTKFPQAWMPWALWAIHIISAIIVAGMLPGKSKEKSRPLNGQAITLTEAMKNAVRTISYICGWVILFRIILSFLDRWILWLVPADIQIPIHGLLELTNGCCEIESISSIGLRFVLCSGMLAFGGICVVMQTASVTGHLGMGLYIPGKILQSAISVSLSYVLQFVFLPPELHAGINPIGFLPVIAVTILLVFLFLKFKIRGRNSISIGV